MTEKYQPTPEKLLGREFPASKIGSIGQRGKLLRNIKWLSSLVTQLQYSSPKYQVHCDSICLTVQICPT